MAQHDIYTATQGRPVTPHDTNTIAVCRALWVTGAGNLTVRFADGGTAVDLGAVTAGSLLPFSVDRVLDTGTDATVIALY